VANFATMAKAKQKFYVVWKGVKPGIYTDWDNCKNQVFGFEGAVYKSFLTKAEAEDAFRKNPYTVLKKTNVPSGTQGKLITGQIITPSWSVDAACSGNPGIMEYRGVDTADKTEKFHSTKYPEGTNNIGEFLAIVHALSLLKRKGMDTLPIYSDSMTAIAWVRNKKAKTELEHNHRTAELHEMIERAEAWLKANSWQNPIYKWETKVWGEIPADFGRK